MPFVKPDTFAVNHISSVLNNLRSRTDMFSIISNTLDHLFNRVKWIRNQGVPNPQEDIGLVSLKKKIEWILLFVDGTTWLTNLKRLLEEHRLQYRRLMVSLKYALEF